eukprot:7382649-Prymnesium_polylepis.1
MAAKSEAGGCLEAHFAWNNSLGVKCKQMNGDNAPDLIMGRSWVTHERFAGAGVCTSRRHHRTSRVRMEQWSDVSGSTARTL